MVSQALRYQQAARALMCLIFILLAGTALLPPGGVLETAFGFASILLALALIVLTYRFMHLTAASALLAFTRLALWPVPDDGRSRVLAKAQLVTGTVALLGIALAV